jgi:hypothetical protein
MSGLGAWRPRLAAVALLGLAVWILAGCGAGASSSSQSASTTPAGLRDAASTSASTSPSSAAPAGSASAASAESAGGTTPPLFNALSPWNTQVAGLPADSRSGAMLALAASNDEHGARGRGVYINTTTWTPTIATEQGGVPTKLFCRQILCGPAAAGLASALIPPDVSPDPRYDGWFTVIDRAAGVAYDFWRARRQADGSISYQYVKRWDLNGPGFSKPSSVNAQNALAARGSGLPLFAGVILPGDLRSGAIDHALAISIPDPAGANYVSPASTTDGVGPQDSLPEGARIRLKANVTLPRLPHEDNRHSADVVLAALKRYGAIVVDRATVPTLYAQKDAVHGLLTGNELQSLRLSDFEVVRLPGRLQVQTGSEQDEGTAGSVAG